MYNNILIEPIFVKELYQEYFTLINRYKNLNRTSIFCRYLNINVNGSSFDFDSKATLKTYENSGIQFDIYDLTPIYLTGPLTNDYQVSTEDKGSILDGTTTIVTYTILNPRMGDLIVFDFPNNSKEIFLVNNIRSTISGRNSTNTNFSWQELTLEYAPISNLNKLNILNKYVYNLSSQSYLLRSDFEIMVKENDYIQILFKLFENKYFDRSKETYFYLDDNKNKIYSLEENKFLYNFLVTKKQYSDFFNNIKRPYRYKNHSTDYKVDKIIYDKFIMVPNILAFPYNTTPNIFEMVNLIKNWVWNNDSRNSKYDKTTELDDRVYTKITYDHENLLK